MSGSRRRMWTALVAPVALAIGCSFGTAGTAHAATPMPARHHCDDGCGRGGSMHTDGGYVRRHHLVGDLGLSPGTPLPLPCDPYTKGSRCPAGIGSPSSLGAATAATS